MADQAAPDNSAADSAGRKPASRFKTLGIVSAIMLIEGGGLFVVTKMIYQKPAELQGGVMDSQAQLMQTLKDHIEIQLPELNAFNRREGRLFMYNIQVSIRIREVRAKDVKGILEAREATVFDRLNTVIRSADIRHLNEPGLDTVRRQFRFELDRILGDDELILELLIPKFLQSPADL